jgi:hypothetical protein
MSIIIVLIILIVLWLLIEILSVVLKMTGLELYKARFQIISILTHTGFTTRESELITQHSLRRKIASVLMVVSYVAQVTLISLFVKILSENQSRLIYAGALLALITIFIFILTRTKYMSTKFNLWVEKILTKSIATQKRIPMDQILKVSPGFGVYELVLDEKNAFCGMSLNNANLNLLQIHVLKVDRGLTTYDFPDAKFVLNHGDRLVLYGKTASITNIALGKTHEANANKKGQANKI